MNELSVGLSIWIRCGSTCRGCVIYCPLIFRVIFNGRNTWFNNWFINPTPVQLLSYQLLYVQGWRLTPPPFKILFRDQFDPIFGIGRDVGPKYLFLKNRNWDKKVPFLRTFSSISENSFFTSKIWKSDKNHSKCTQNCRYS